MNNVDFILKWFKRLLMSLGVLMLFFIIVGFTLTMMYSKKTTVEKNSVLTINFEKKIVEYASDDEFMQELFGRRVTILQIIQALDKAANDKRITGLMAKIGETSLSYAQVQEIRDAVKRFKQSGKKAIIFAETFSETSNGTRAFYLASAFDEIYLQPSGMLGLTGIATETMFFKKTFDKLGVEAVGGHRKEYKNAWNMFTEDSYTKEHEEAMEAMIGSIYKRVIADISTDRKISLVKLQELVDKAPLFAKGAQSSKLIDGIIYRDQFIERGKKVFNYTHRLPLFSYYSRTKKEVPEAEGKAIALIYGDGEIRRGKSDFDPYGESNKVGSDTVAAAVRRAEKDPQVNGIIIRVDSPGGSVVASETIWREVQQVAQNSSKPIYISMGSLAASGGYYIAMSADKIIAQPSTLTGSIGVYTGKLYAEKLWEKLGITFDSVQIGENARLYSSNTRFDEKQMTHINNTLDKIYQDFVKRVAKGRNLDPKKAEEAAKGRVWTGEQARNLGLVDELGGLDKTLSLMKEELNMDPQQKVYFKQFPKQPDFFDFAFKKSDDEEIQMEISIFSKLRTLLKQLFFISSQFEQSSQPVHLKSQSIHSVH